LVIAVVCVSIAATGTLAGAPGEFELRPGEAKEFDGITVGFDVVRSDGRCPIGVYCFWEGDAACALWAEAPNLERSEFVLHTSAMFMRETTVAGWRITLQHLDPYPVYQRPTDPGDYVVTLQLSQDSLTPAQETTWSRIKAMYR
jgi:hypothetical protein